MCQLTSSRCHNSCKCNSNVVYLWEGSGIYEPLVRKGPTLEPVERCSFTIPLVVKEAISIGKIALPMILTGLMLYSRSVISMIFLGRLGELALAGGSLAIGFANITGYSVLSGLAMGMESICGQAFGARKFTFSEPRCRERIAKEAQLFLIHSLPDLFAQSLLHPLRIYLRTQSITLPLTCCAILSILLHVPINYLLVSHLRLGIKGVALSGVWTNFNLVGSLIIYILYFGVHKKTWGGFSMECFKEWKSLLDLAIPSCISVCLEWWCVDLHIPIFFKLQCIDQSRERTGCKPAEEGKTGGLCRPLLRHHAGVCSTFFAVMVGNVWATMFTDDKDIIALTSAVLPIIGLCELGNCPQTTGCGVLRGTARPKQGANINLCCFYLVGMPVAVWLGFFAGFDFKGLWLGMLAAQGSCMVTMMVVLIRTDWDFEAERAKELTGAVVDGSKQAENEKPRNAQNKEDSFSLLGDLDHYCLV
ncbi:putative 4-hydroxy-tetrahydrodipicolinate reductase 3 [Hibiscus syriacus]|uniref:Protein DETOXIFICATION n=1 Tax=Hibiscus syriacus TaxID=106335 RepID=A0A6A2Y8K7_HIBSY|nr:putative 4-hydroxy-tetrahydrodipicolinate reductase 3 [Hibiscus syriacus]